MNDVPKNKEHENASAPGVIAKSTTTPASPGSGSQFGESPFKRRVPKWMWIFSGCFGVSALAVILVVSIPAVIAWRWMREGERQLADETKLLLDSGEPATPDDLERYYRLPEGAVDTTPQWIAAGQEFNSEEFKKEAESIPIVGRGTGDGAEDAPVPPPGQSWGRLEATRELLARHARAMSQMHEAARAGGAARFPTRFEDGIAMVMDDVTNLRPAARMLLLEAHVKAHERDSAGALRSMVTMLRMARSIETYPDLVPLLTRIAISTMDYHLIAELLPYLDLSDEDLVGLAHELTRDDFDDGIYRSFLGERVMGLHTFDHPDAAMDESDDKEKAERFREFSTKWMKGDRAFYLEHLRRIIAITKEGWPTKLDSARNLSQELEQLIKNSNKFEQLAHLLSFLLLPAEEAVFNANGRAITYRDGTIVAIAAIRHRNRHGQLPDSLDKLVPEFLDKIPRDPFDGRPLRYRVDADKFIVYSVAENRRDDGGIVKGEDGRSFPDYVVTIRIVGSTTPGK